MLLFPQVLHMVSTGSRGTVLGGAPTVTVPEFSAVVREDMTRTDTLRRAQRHTGIQTTVRLAARSVSVQNGRAFSLHNTNH